MKRESLITKLVAFMLCVMMVVGCLPVSAFATENDWEGDIDIVETEPPLGSESNPINLTSEWVWNEANTEATVTVTVPAGNTIYYLSNNVGGMTMTIGDGDPVVCSGDPRTPYVWSIANDGEAEADYVITIAYPVGSMENPAEAYLGDNTATIEAGSQGYFFTYIAPCDSKIIMTIDAATGWTYTINNVTAGTYGDTQWSDSDPVVNSATIELAEGEEIEIVVNTYDPADMWNNPAGTITMNLEQVSGVCATCAIFLGEMENNVTNAGTVYYQGYFSGTVMTVSGEGDFNVIYNGETIAAVDGVVSTAVSSPNPRMPVVFAIEGDGEYSVSFAYPAGSQSNPAFAVLGDNPAAIEAGNTQGYFWTYTAEKAGDLVFTFSSSDNNWTYTINNMTTGAYGETQWNDSDPVVNPATITVAEGDEIQIIVNTYDPANMWSTPAGTVTFNLAYAPEGPVADANLKFMQTALSLQEYIGLQGIITKAVYNSYDRVYLEVVQATPEGEVTSTLTPFVYMTNYYIFDVQVLAWSMTEEVTMTLYAEKDGITYIGQTVTTSVEQKALSMLATYSTNEKQAATCRLLVDMLNYGAEVQKAFNHNIESIPDASAYASLGTTDTPAFNATNTKTGSGTVSVLTHAVSMQAKVEIQTAFKGDVSAYVLRYTVDGVTEEIPASEFGTYYGYPFVTVAIKAANMRKNYTIALYDPATDQPVSPVYTTSIEGFAQTQLGGTYNDVFVAMMKYGDSVAAIA